MPPRFLKGVHKMKKKNIIITLLILLLIAGVGIGTWTLAASTYGTSSDPLITLSYLNDKVMPAVLSEFQKKMDAKVSELTNSYEKRIKELEDKLNNSAGGGSGTFSVVELKNGQSISCSEGAEIMLRSGSAQAWSEISDLTSGSPLELGGMLVQNHMYTIPYSGGGLGVISDSTLLIRGSYKIN